MIFRRYWDNIQVGSCGISLRNSNECHFSILQGFEYMCRLCCRTALQLLLSLSIRLFGSIYDTSSQWKAWLISFAVLCAE